MSWFPEPKYQQEVFERCYEFDKKMEKLSYLSDEDRAKLLEEFNAEMQSIHNKCKNGASN